MLSPIQHPHETERLAEVQQLGLYGAEPTPQLDDLTHLVAAALSVPLAMITVVGQRDIWLLARVGIPAREAPRDMSICGHTILQDQVLVVPDTRLDTRFADNPTFNGQPPIRAYAGLPILSDDGLPIGTLCVVDHIPRAFTDLQISLLRHFAGAVRRELFSTQMLMRAQAEVQHGERALAEMTDRFRAVFEDSAIGIAIVALDGRWISVNRMLCDIVGYTADEMKLLSFQDITYAADLDADLSQLQQAVAGTIDRYQMEKRYVRKDGSLVWVNLTVSIKQAPDGSRYFISVVEDIQARKMAEDSLRALRLDLEQKVVERTDLLRKANENLIAVMGESLAAEKLVRSRERELRTIIENAPDAYVCIDEGGVICDWNREAELVFGWTRDEAVGRRLDETIIPSRHRKAHRDGLSRYLSDGKSNILGKRIEQIAIHRNGSSIPVEMRIQLIETERGRRFTAFLQNISERRHAEQALENERIKLKMIADHVPAMILYLDRDLRYRFANQAYQDQLGIDPASLIGRDAGSFFEDDHDADLRARLRHALAGNLVEWTHERELRGEMRHWALRFVPDRENGEIVGLFGMVMDITERRRQEISREHDARFDVLTGLLNRRGLFEVLQQRLTQAVANGMAISLMLLDVNQFKSINDGFGHAAGDTVLREIGRRLSQLTQMTAARLGGDEFVVIGAEAPLRASGMDADIESVNALFHEPVMHDGQAITVSASIGRCARVPKSDTTAEDLLQGADAAMYRQKKKRSGYLRKTAELPCGHADSCDHLCDRPALCQTREPADRQAEHRPKLYLRGTGTKD